MRQAFGKGFVLGGAIAGAMATDASASSRRGDLRIERDAEQVLCPDATARRAIPAPDGKLTFDKLS